MKNEQNNGLFNNKARSMDSLWDHVLLVGVLWSNIFISFKSYSLFLFLFSFMPVGRGVASLAWCLAFFPFLFSLGEKRKQKKNQEKVAATVATDLEMKKQFKNIFRMKENLIGM